jgi:hypothetical protein
MAVYEGVAAISLFLEINSELEIENLIFTGIRNDVVDYTHLEDEFLIAIKARQEYESVVTHGDRPSLGPEQEDKPFVTGPIPVIYSSSHYYNISSKYWTFTNHNSVFYNVDNYNINI